MFAFSVRSFLRGSKSVVRACVFILRIYKGHCWSPRSRDQYIAYRALIITKVSLQQ